MMDKKLRLYEAAFILSKEVVAGPAVQEALLCEGVSAVDIVSQEDQRGCRVSVFLSTKGLAADLCRRIDKLRFKGVKIAQHVHDRDDWQTRWKKDWKPFALTPRIHVIPRFIDQAECPRGKIPLYLDTTAAFGTGLHETTRFSSQLIEMRRGEFRAFLDIGTGTGILAAVAFLSGAVYVEAFDIDPDAVVVARNNLKVNHLRCNFLSACDVKKYKARRMFDLVAANLVTHDLVACADKIISCVAPGGHLIISGISLRNISLIKRTYVFEKKLKCRKMLKGREWAAFLLQK